MLIDARDTEFIWCVAEIREIFFARGEVLSILIHYKGWNNIYDEILEITSSRLAQHRFYTSRVDIPHYHMSHQVEDSMHSYVVIGDMAPNLPIVDEMPEP